MLIFQRVSSCNKFIYGARMNCRRRSVSSDSLFTKHPSNHGPIPLLQPQDLALPSNYIILGIESSCDDTSICLLKRSSDINGLKKELLFEKTINQTDIHRYYGGVVPYLASKEHRHRLPFMIKEVIEKFGVKEKNFGGFHMIAATRGPGLPASLSAGWYAAKTLSAALNVPLMGVHHMEGHALMAKSEYSTKDPSFPFFCLLLSGGHTLLLKMECLGKYEILGQALDDNIGECLDKGARQLGLQWMDGLGGGLAAQLEEVAKSGDPHRFSFPLPLTLGGRDYGFNFSFSGLKSSLSNHLDLYRKNITTNAVSPSDYYTAFPDGKELVLDPQTLADFAASYQRAVFNHVLHRLQRYHKKIPDGFGMKQILVVSGGVARNQTLRSMLEEFCTEKEICLIFAPPKYCTDNALMIANAAIERIEANEPFQDGLYLETKPEWPLTNLVI